METKIMIGNAPCSWGTLEFEGLDTQPLTYPRMLDELTAAGYTGTELGDWGFMPTQTDHVGRRAAPPPPGHDGRVRERRSQGHGPRTPRVKK